MSIIHVHSLDQLNKLLGASEDKLTISSLLGAQNPCVAFSPIFEEYPKQFPTVNFVKVDVDECRDVASHYGITAMPTFIYLKGATKVHQIRGAQRSAVESAIRKYMVPGAFEGMGQTLGGDGPASIGELAAGLSPQVKTLLTILGVYILFWYLGSK